MEQSPSITNLAVALNQAQVAFEPIARNAKNPFFKSKYADLAAVFMAIKEPLLANGLTFVQATDVADDGDIIVETQLMHITGEWIRGRLKMAPGVSRGKGKDDGAPVNRKPTPQEMGSAFTYARRYALAAMVGIPVEGEDDDGAAGSGTTSRGPEKPQNAPKENPKPTPPAKPTPPSGGEKRNPDAVTAGQVKTFLTMLTNKGYGNPDLKEWLKEAKGLEVASSNDIPKTLANDILAWIESLPGKGE